MTIAEKLLRTKDDFDAVYEAGRKSVGEVLKFTDVSSNAYRSTVPNGVEPFARVDKIGGMTYKSKNLFAFPYSSATLTSAGITFTDNGDGSITLNGTNDGQYNSTFFLSTAEKPINFHAGTYRAAAFGSNGERLSSIEFVAYDGVEWISIHNKPLTIDKNRSFGIYIQIPKGETNVYDNVTVYPMLNEGTTALPYEPYFEGLRSASVSELKSEGANLIPFPYADVANETLNGVTFTLNEDNTITVNGTATSDVTYILKNLRLKGTYTLNGTVNGSKTTYYMAIGSSDYADIGNGVTRTYDEEIAQNIFVRIVNGATLENVIFKPILNYGSIAVPYKPYVGTLDTLAIPEAVKSLDGYGLGVDAEYYSYIDFERKVFVQRVKKIVFTGDEALRQYGNYSNCVRFIGKWFDDGRQESRLILCTHFKWGQLEPNCVSVGSGNERGSFWLDPSLFTTETTNAEREATFKAWLKEQYDNGTPVTAVYELETPIETDISAYLTDEYIEVEGGGTITAVNEYEYDVPTNISYLTDTQGG